MRKFPLNLMVAVIAVVLCGVLPAEAGATGGTVAVVSGFVAAVARA